jgi:hypothetical protein
VAAAAEERRRAAVREREKREADLGGPGRGRGRKVFGRDRGKETDKGETMGVRRWGFGSRGGVEGVEEEEVLVEEEVEDDVPKSRDGVLGT